MAFGLRRSGTGPSPSPGTGKSSRAEGTAIACIHLSSGTARTVNGAGARGPTPTFRATLLRREALQGTEVAALGPTYYDDPDRQAMWSRFRRQIEVQGYEPNSLAEAGAVVRAFLTPVWSSILREEPCEMEWPPGGPWRSHGSGADGEGGRP